MSFFAPSLASVRIFFIFIRVFSSLLSSVHLTMIQAYFTPQFLGTMFSFVLVCAKCSSLQCFSTFLRVLRSALTQQFSLYVCVYGWVCVYVCMYVWNNKETALYPRGGGVLPYIAYTGMCRPTGSWFWSSWFRTGYPFQRRFLERGIIFRTHESSSFVSSHLKLFKGRLLLKIRLNALLKQTVILLLHLRTEYKKLAHF